MASATEAASRHSELSLVCDTSNQNNALTITSDSPVRNDRTSSEAWNTTRAIKKKTKNSAFPKTFTKGGWLDVRTRDKSQFKRRYFVLANNFLLGGSTPLATKLERVIPLEGTNVNGPVGDVSFEITSRRKRFQFRAGSPAESESWKGHITRASTLRIKDIYRFLFTLGASATDNTKVVAAEHRVSGRPCAIKIIDKRKYDAAMLSNEVNILKRLNHPNIVELYDLFETRKYLYLVMERCDGGELFDQIAQLDQGYSEATVCRIMHQVAGAVKYMHANGIVHRDLKPENILCKRENSVSDVKLADFGISKIVGPSAKDRRKAKKAHGRTTSTSGGTIAPPRATDATTMQTQVGTLSYTAPEIMRGLPYNKAVDSWSLGIIMYILLCGYPPFYGETDEQIAHSILADELEFDPEEWSHVSDSGKRLVEGLLDRDPTSRSDVDAILRHSFVESSRVDAPRARNKLRQTIVKNNIARKMSFGVFEMNSRLMQRIGYRSRDDSVTNLRTRSSLRARKSTSSSRECEDLFELRLPLSGRSLSRNSHTLDQVDEHDIFNVR